MTRLLYSRSGQATVAAVNTTEHVWDLLPRNQRLCRQLARGSRRW